MTPFRRYRYALHLLACLALLWATPRAEAQPAPASNWQAMDDTVEALYVAGQIAEAVAAARLALAAANGPRETGRSHGRLGFLLHTSGNLPEAELHLRESLKIREAAFGVDSLDYAESAHDLALWARDRGRADEARTFAEQSVAIRRRHLQPTDTFFLLSLNTLGSVYGIGGDYPAAARVGEEAVMIHESVAPEKRAHAEYGTLCVNLASTYQRLGKYPQASASLAKGLAALRISPGIKHPAYAISLFVYASLQVELGNYVEAEALYDEGARVFVEQLPETHPSYAAFLNNRGSLYQTLGNYALAERDLTRSLELKTQLFGRTALTSASTLSNLGRATLPRDAAAGEQLLREAATIMGTAKAPPFDHVTTLLGLAGAQRQRGALTDAIATLQQALEIAERGLGTSHPLYASVVRDLGLVQNAAGDFAGAERQLTAALATAEGTYGPTHPNLVLFLRSLARFQESRDNLPAALALYRRSFEIEDGFLNDALAVGSETFKEAALASLNDPVQSLIALQQKAGDTLPEARTLAFEAATRRKGRLLEQVRSWRQRLRESPSDAVIPVLDEWETIVKCRTSLTVALGYHDLKPSIVGACGLEGTNLEGRYERLLSELRSQWTEQRALDTREAIALLKERADQLETTLVRMLGRGETPPSRITVAELTSKLAGDEVLVEYVSYLADATGGRGGQRYGAFLLDRAGQLSWADLGLAEPIDSAVRDLLSAANDWSVSIRNREARAARTSESTAEAALTEISQRVWRPLEPLLVKLPAVRRLQIAPDASLNLVPFEALAAETGDRRLIDRYSMAYITAGRGLIVEPGGVEAVATGAGAPVIVVSPGADPPRAASPVSPSAFRAESLARLEHAGLEGRDIRRLLPHAVLLDRGDASETRVKAVAHPSILHIVGHGVVRSVEECVAAPCADASRSGPGRAGNMSAIVLEEAYGRATGSTDDGILTPQELQEMDLRGTEMLVLSQCQMASGVASVGEGVYGMRRAAAVAGADTFVAPLWNVDDRVQRTLMQQFYRDLVAGKSRADALRDAKLRLKLAPATRSFLYWSPVILSGDATPIESLRAVPR